MEAARIMVSVRVLAAARKKEEKEKGKEGTSLSTAKVIRKGAPKRKVNGKNNCPSKKALVTLREKQPKKPLPPKPSHGASKGLMTASGPIAQGTRRLLMHKGWLNQSLERRT